MTIDTDKAKQTHDGTSVDANTDRNSPSRRITDRREPSTSHREQRRWRFRADRSVHKRPVRSIRRRCRHPSEKNAKPVRSAGRVVRKAQDRGRRKPLLGRAGRTGRESGSDPPQPTPTGSQSC
ncbi:hypothetical protein DY000_02048862 [Brassica cretica]|uniref:Uncharacterized protein n=1 Tax=Brassica cretica TaxID=69181 RepID=A0ABQ7EY38_BRACR|nr:hypothetical protein DY000_02048862 [Brassica cretica]